MQNMIIVDNLKFVLTDGEVLFQDISFGVEEKERVALLGDNGSGKTTILKILSKEISDYEGNVEVKGKVFVVPQLKDVGYAGTVGEYVSTKTKIVNSIHGEMDLGYISVPLSQKLDTLSGGEFVKLHLEISKILEPDILILDEPTNHLDGPGRVMLFSYMEFFPGSILFVSHDEEFIEKFAEKILFIYDKKLFSTKGKYEDHKVFFENYLGGIKRQFEQLEKEERKLKKAKQEEQKRFERSQKTGKKIKLEGGMSGMQQGFFKDHSEFGHGKKKKQIERLQGGVDEEKEKLSLEDDIDLRFAFPNKGEKEKLLLRIKGEGLSIADKTLLKKISFELYYGERIELSGPNGSGKSQFIKKFLQNADLKIAYLDQFYSLISPEKTILENVLAQGIDIEIARKVLSAFGFTDNEQVKSKPKNLSGGELCRLSLASISAMPLDVLVLDEPTNNLDIKTKKTLVKAVNKFNGALIVISHDKNFVDSIGVAKKYIIRDKEIIKSHL